MIYTKEELEEFNKIMHKRMKEIIEENQQRYHHILDNNNRTIQLPEDEYIAKMVYDYKEHCKRKKFGKKHTEFNPEIGWIEY